MPLFEELDFQTTPFGDISLRRREIPNLTDDPIYEVKIGDEWLMSSLFTVVEIALADLGIAALGDQENLDIVVGGLGLGCTAHAALAYPQVANVTVVEALAPVIRWHRDNLVPRGAELAENPRCHLVNGDFFSLAAAPEVGFDPEIPARRWDAILLDIDHSPEKLLNPENGDLYSKQGLQTLSQHLNPNGIFAMWSDDPPHEEFMDLLASAFNAPTSHIIPFDNPHQGTISESTVYVARNSSSSSS